MPYTSRQLADAAAVIEPLLRLRAIYARVPGVAFGLRHEDVTILLGAHGEADLATDRAVDPATTSFRCASITKTMTATLVLRLVEKGRLRLDDTVNEWLAWTKGSVGPDVTLRHLLMHSSGIIRDGSNNWEDTMPDLATFRRELRGAATFDEPSARFRYSNIAYVLLGEIAERATGRSFATLLRQEVFRPLDLRASFPDLGPAARRTLATGYWAARPGEPRVVAPHVEARAVAPAGGLVSTVPDLLEYQRAQLPGDPRLLREHTKREMQRPHWLRGGEPHYGLGWMTWHVDGISLIGHSGGYPGFVTKIGFAPQDGLCAAVLTNVGASFATEALNLLYHCVASVAARWEAAAATTKWHARGSLQRFVGCYRCNGADLVIARVNGALLAIAPLEPEPIATASRLEPKGARTFLVADGDDFGFLGEQVSFAADRTGRITTLHYGAHVYTREVR